MIHVYKSGGPWKTDGKEYTVKAIQPEDKSKYISDGWVSSLDEVKEPEPKAEEKPAEDKKPVKKEKATKDDDKE